LAFLVLVKFLGSYKIIERDVGIFGNDSVGFRRGGELLVEVADISVSRPVSIVDRSLSCR
jgi:hypothetical protein